MTNTAVPAGAPGPSNEIATIESAAAFQFDPIPDEKVRVLSKHEWCELYEGYVLAANVAQKMLARSKPELAKLAEDLLAEENLTSLNGMREILEGGTLTLQILAEPIKAAEIRLISACCLVTENVVAEGEARC